MIFLLIYILVYEVIYIIINKKKYKLSLYETKSFVNFVLDFIKTRGGGGVLCKIKIHFKNLVDSKDFFNEIVKFLHLT